MVRYNNPNRKQRSYRNIFGGCEAAKGLEDFIERTNDQKMGYGLAELFNKATVLFNSIRSIDNVYEHGSHGLNCKRALMQMVLERVYDQINDQPWWPVMARDLLKNCLKAKFVQSLKEIGAKL